MVFFPRFYKTTRDFPLFHKIWLPLIFAPPNIVSLLEKFFSAAQMTASAVFRKRGFT